MERRRYGEPHRGHQPSFTIYADFVASQLLSAGVDVRTVAGRLGHRNAATTLNVYAHFLEQSDRAAADVMGRLIADESDEVDIDSTRRS